MTFKDSTPFHQRKRLANSLLSKFSNEDERIPMIVEPYTRRDPKILKSKYIVPKSASMGNVLKELRKGLSLTPKDTVFFFIDQKLGTTTVPNNSEAGILYDRYKDDDGFLYVVYTVENCFG